MERNNFSYNNFPKAGDTFIMSLHTKLNNSINVNTLMYAEEKDSI